MPRHKSAAVIVLVTFVSAAGAAPAPGTKQDRAYCDGAEVQLEVSASRIHFRPNETFRLGPWKFGDKIREEKQRDGRPNLYVVLPGTQYTNEKWPGYDHTVLLNRVPETDDAVEWDVYFAVVLDPELKDEFHDERELLVATQKTFMPGEGFKFEQIPSAKALSTLLHISSMEELQKLARPDGELPRVAIVPAGFAVKASAKPTATETALQ